MPIDKTRVMTGAGAAIHVAHLVESRARRLRGLSSAGFGGPYRRSAALCQAAAERRALRGVVAALQSVPACDDVNRYADGLELELDKEWQRVCEQLSSVADEGASIFRDARAEVGSLRPHPGERRFGLAMWVPACGVAVALCVALSLLGMLLAG